MCVTATIERVDDRKLELLRSDPVKFKEQYTREGYMVLPSPEGNHFVNRASYNAHDNTLTIEGGDVSGKKCSVKIDNNGKMVDAKPNSDDPVCLAMLEKAPEIARFYYQRLPQSLKFTLEDPLGNNYVTSISIAGKGVYLISGENSRGEPRSILYDAKTKTFTNGYDKTPNLGIVGNQMRSNIESIFKHFNVEFPKPEQKSRFHFGKKGT